MIRNELKRTIFVSGGLELLQMARHWGGVPIKDTRLLRGVNCEIPHRLEKKTKYSL